uniref:HDC11838 n=1 Tax=Drosophila melanogaster TaxID=7227 RepID=Q6IKQ8_DROME|nr:TPA_inf: HDC11838 [Drosophila melanogaster]
MPQTKVSESKLKCCRCRHSRRLLRQQVEIVAVHTQFIPLICCERDLNLSGCNKVACSRAAKPGGDHVEDIAIDSSARGPQSVAKSENRAVGHEDGRDGVPLCLITQRTVDL